MDIRICTFNVNSIKARIKLLGDWLRQRGNDIDILMLQELKTEESGFPEAELKSAGFDCHVFGQKSYNGVAVCSKIPILSSRKGFGNGEWDKQSRLITVRTAGMDLVNLYAPHGELPGGEKYKYKQEWYEYLHDWLARNFDPQSPLVVAGDFNIAREDRDVYSPEALRSAVGTLPEERALMTRILDWGLVDIHRRLLPDTSEFTWWDYRTAGIWRNEGMRIDYVLCTRPLIDLFTEIEVDLWTRRRRNPTPSDHAPLVARLRL